MFFFINYFLILAIIAQISNPIAEPVISIGIPTKEAKDEMETHLVIAQHNLEFYILCFLLINSC